MGWASGSRLFSKIIEAIKQNVPDEAKRKEIYKGLIEAFEKSDWDTQDECMGEDDAYDAALTELHPDWYSDDEDDEDDQTPEERSQLEALNLGVGGRGVAEH